ncbi:hypothetical protein TNCV_357801 [Trichonephila clavipes]|nr:hypothetical protein TNCV_357801 [Trichonephila clavipes]
MEGKGCVWAKNDVVTAVGIFGLFVWMIVVQSRLVSHQIVVFLIDFGSPPIPIIALWTTKGDFRAISLFERRRRISFDFQRTSLTGPALDSTTSSGRGRDPALQCRTPSRHHLELQDRRDYTPADRAARTCWLGCPGLLYYLAA